MMRDKIVARIEELLQEEGLTTLRRDISGLKEQYYAASKTYFTNLKKQFVEEGGNPDEFTAPQDDIFPRFKELLAEFSEKMTVIKAAAAARKAEEIAKMKIFLTEKIAILDELKALIANEGNITKAFESLKDIQARWKNVGRITLEEYKPIMSDYKFQLVQFFSQVEMLRDFRDLDSKKNLEAKQKLMADLQELDASDLAPAQKSEKLRRIQSEWNKIGPIPQDLRETFNAEYRALSDKVFSDVQTFFEGRREELKTNLTAKEELIGQIQAILTEQPQTMNEWGALIDKVQAIQEAWKNIGFSEKNEEIWQTFRNACNEFFENRKQFTKGIDHEREANRVKKLTLCEKAESLQNDTNWRETTQTLVALQKEWKTIGPAPRSQENKLWERFRTACDSFFEAKKASNETSNAEHAENLKQKEALIERLEALELSGSTADDFKTLRDFSAEWNKIGLVPFEQKEVINKRYNKALDAKYALVRGEKVEKSTKNYKTKLEDIQHGSNANQVFRREQAIINSKIEALQKDITQYENNMGFFKNAKSDSPLIKGIKDNINRAKEEVAELMAKLKALDEVKNTPPPATTAPQQDLPANNNNENENENENEKGEATIEAVETDNNNTNE